MQKSPEKAVPGSASSGRVKSSSGTQHLMEKLQSTETRAQLLSSFPWLQGLWKHLCWQEYATGTGSSFPFRQ